MHPTLPPHSSLCRYPLQQRSQRIVRPRLAARPCQVIVEPDSRDTVGSPDSLSVEFPGRAANDAGKVGPHLDQGHDGAAGQLIGPVAKALDFSLNHTILYQAAGMRLCSLGGRLWVG